MAHVYTTGEIAKLCKVVPKTVVDWTKDGLIESYHDSGNPSRLFTRENLIHFLAHHGILEHTFYYHAHTVLILSHAAELKEALTTALANGPFRALTSTNPFDIAAFVHDSIAQFCWAVIDMREPHFGQRRICEELVGRGWNVIVISDQEQPRPQLIRDFFEVPFDPTLLATRLLSLLNE